MPLRLVTLAIVLLSSLANCLAQTTQPTTRPVPQIERALLISIDGLRPDVLLMSPAPNIRGLLKRSTYTFWARTVPEAYTLPSHVSMLTGYPPEKHGVTWNGHIEQAYAEVPTIFELAKKAGLTTAMVSGKTKFIALQKPGTLDWSVIPNDEPNPDIETTAKAVSILKQHRPQVMFVHLANVDEAGHADGWGTPPQFKTIAAADTCVGMLLKTLDELGLTDKTVVLLTADHGGAGRVHDPGDLRAAHIPWIIAGPGLRKEFDLTRVVKLQICTEDTTATLCALLGIPTASDMKGRFVDAVVDRGELLMDPP